MKAASFLLDGCWSMLVCTALACAALVCAPWCGPALGQAPVEMQLDNGLQVVLKPIANAQRTCLIVFYSIGDRHDPPGQSGMSHLSEHLYITAATENSEAREKVQRITRRVREGVHAQTGDDFTLIANVFFPEELDQQLSDAADRMRQLKVTEADLLREIQAIAEEIEQAYVKFPQLAVANLGRHQQGQLAHGGRRGGVLDQLKSIRPEQVQKWLDQYYKPANATMVLAGPFDLEAIQATITEHFGEISAGETPPLSELTVPESQSTVQSEFAPIDNIDRTLIGITFNAPRPDDPLYPAFLVQVARLQFDAGLLSREIRNPVLFQPLNVPDFLYLSYYMKAEETVEESINKLDAYIDQQVSLPGDAKHIQTAIVRIGSLLGLRPIPDLAYTSNPYPLAFRLGRVKQMGLDLDSIGQELVDLTDEELQAAKTLFEKSRRTIVVLTPKPED